jgi:hypothetical protein
LLRGFFTVSAYVPEKEASGKEDKGKKGIIRKNDGSTGIPFQPVCPAFQKLAAGC